MWLLNQHFYGSVVIDEGFVSRYFPLANRFVILLFNQFMKTKNDKSDWTNGYRIWLQVVSLFPSIKRFVIKITNWIEMFSGDICLSIVLSKKLYAKCVGAHPAYVNGVETSSSPHKIFATKTHTASIRIIVTNTLFPIALYETHEFQMNHEIQSHTYALSTQHTVFSVFFAFHLISFVLCTKHNPYKHKSFLLSNKNSISRCNSNAKEYEQDGKSTFYTC